MSYDDYEDDLLELCEQLLLHDPSISVVDALGFGQGYGQPLGEALLHNNRVATLKLDVSCIVSYHADNTDEALSLLQYIRSSQSLKHVVLKEDDDLDLVDAIVEAVTASSSIESLNPQVEISVHHLVNLLHQTTSLRKLIVYWSISYDLPEARRLVIDALQANQTLEVLDLLPETDTADANPSTLQAVLPELCSHPKLLELCVSMRGIDLSDNTAVLDSLIQFLNSSLTLQHLGMQECNLNTELLQLIFRTLQSKPLISKLTLKGCELDEDATAEFVRFMQDKESGETSVVQELYIQLFSNSLFANYAIGETLVEMLQDSSLQVLGLGDKEAVEEELENIDLATFFDTLAANANHVYLPALQLSHVLEDESEEMAKYLRTTAYLQSLTVSKMDADSSRRLLLSAIRDNGSLHGVKIHYVNEDGKSRSFFRRRERARLNAYLERNRSVPLLLAKPCLYDHVANNDGDMDHVDANDEQDGSIEEHGTDLSLFPGLFVAGLRAPRMAPKDVLIGLLAAEEQVVL
jgi:hypothetical protein